MAAPPQKTDGNGHKIHSIGSGVYCASRDFYVRINPRGLGATNTINRAELVAICYSLGLPGADRVIATDGLASMYMIHNEVHHPSNNIHSPHKALLERIASLLTARAEAGYFTHIIKVKVHTRRSWQRGG